MVGVVGDVELDYLLFLALFVFFHEGEDQAAIGGVCSLHLEFLLTAVHDGLPFAALAAGHDKLNAVALLPTRRVEGAGAHQHANHVESAILAGISIDGGGVLVALITHLNLALAAWVTVPYVFSAIGFALKGAFFVILRHEVEAGISGEGVAHLEDVVGPLGAAGDEVGFVGWLTIVGGAGDIHRSRARLQPNKLPIEIEVVDECFATIERRIFRRALRLGLQTADEGEEEEEKDFLHNLLGFSFGWGGANGNFNNRAV